MPRPTLVCCAYHFGYGPAAKLLHIARKLTRYDLRLVFLGYGISRELALRSEIFDEVIQMSPQSPIGQSILAEASAVLSLMDRENTAVALAMGKRVYAVDSLAWMRDRFTDLEKSVHRYWVQRFVDDENTRSMIGDHARLVGPIVGDCISDSASRNGPILVNLGGCDSPLSSTTQNLAYVDFVISGLEALSKESILLAGEKCVDHIRSRLRTSKIEVMSVAHDQALQLISCASQVLTSPGLTATYECFQAGVPTYFLPPQNYSQWWILNHLREHNLASRSFHWSDLLHDHGIQPRMAVDERTQLVYGAIERISASSIAKHQLRKEIEMVMQDHDNNLVRRQRDFFASLGSPGTDSIAEELWFDLCDIGSSHQTSGAIG
jgi:hypothetical protein